MAAGWRGQASTSGLGLLLVKQEPSSCACYPVYFSSDGGGVTLINVCGVLCRQRTRARTYKVSQGGLA